MNRQEILLKEYEVCQRDIDSSALSYWTLAGIFIGISSALLAGVIYAVLANNDLFGILLWETRTRSELWQIVALTIITIILGGGVIFILVSLKCWLKREKFLSAVNYERMREIALELGMWKSWRVHTIDQWHKIRDRKLTDKEIWNKLRGKLNTNLDGVNSERLDKREWRLVELVKRYLPQQGCERSEDDPEYIRPSRYSSYPAILFTLISLWGILIASVLIRLIIGLISFYGP